MFGYLVEFCLLFCFFFFLPFWSTLTKEKKERKKKNPNKVSLGRKNEIYRRPLEGVSSSMSTQICSILAFDALLFLSVVYAGSGMFVVTGGSVLQTNLLLRENCGREKD